MTKLYHVQLTDQQHEELEQLIHSGKALAQVQTRARILLLAHRGKRDVDIVQALLTSLSTVQRTRARFVEEGLTAALKGKTSPGRPPRLTGDVEDHLTMLACSTPPHGRSRWTMQLLADRLIELRVVDTISDEAVRKKLKKTNSSLGLSSIGAYPKPMPNT